MIQIALVIFYSLSFIFIIKKWSFFKIDGLNNNHLVTLFICKILIGIFIWQLYLQKFPYSDALAFYEESKVLFDSLFHDPIHFLKLLFGINTNDPGLNIYKLKMPLWEDASNTILINDSRTMIRYNAVIRFFAFGTYHVHTVFSCFIALVGLVYIYRSVVNFFKGWEKILFLIVFVSPSVLFWGSTVYKESILFLGLGLLIYHTSYGLRRNYTTQNLIGSTLGFFLMLLIKPYILFALFPGLIINRWLSLTEYKNVVFKYVFSIIILFSLILNLPKFYPGLNFLEKIKQKQIAFNNTGRGGVYLYSDNHYIYVEYKDRFKVLDYATDSTCYLKEGFVYKEFVLHQPDTLKVTKYNHSNLYKIVYTGPTSGSYTYRKPIDGDIKSFLSDIPEIFTNTLLMPQLSFRKGGWESASLLENYLYLSALLFSLFFIKIKKRYLPIILFIICFIFILYTMIGLTTPVVGATIRYKVPAQPFVGILLLMLFDLERVEKLWNRLFRK